MFKCGDAVMYSTSGACKITSETEKEYLGKAEVCFVLEPIFSGNMKIYVPKSNDKLISKMRHMMTKEALLSLIKNFPEKGEEYIPNDALRRQKYNELMALGDQIRIAGIIKTLYEKKIEQTENKKKLHQCDEYLLKEAQKLLYDEIVFVFDISPDSVHEFILENK